MAYADSPRGSFTGREERPGLGQRPQLEGLLLGVSPTAPLKRPDRDRDRHATGDDENHDGDDDLADAHSRSVTLAALALSLA